jgi:ParB-like chromosome segregation protein Spo0J
MIVNVFGIKINQEYAKLVPPLSSSDYQRLKEGIELNGILIPIIVNEQGEILDGHHRYKIHVVDLKRPV